MNGFVHTILSFMLSWIRALISNIWSVITSEDGGALYQFLQNQWLRGVLALFLLGVLVDLIVYFFRWRPDYIWRSRMRRPRRQKAEKRKKKAAPAPEPDPAPAPAYSASYAPSAASAAPTRVYAPVQELSEPVFDEEAALWEEAVQPMQTDWSAQELPEFGAPRPEPIAYYHDIQAGYAPPVPPEQLYAPSASYQSPVHPGLNEDAFRQSFGLQTDEEALQERAVPVVRAPAFRPFTVVEENEPDPRTANPFARFARRARTLVGMEDEGKGPSIHDLQSTVDVSQAFHEPVYPQSSNQHREG